MKKLAILLLGLGSLAVVSVNANNLPQSEQTQPVAVCQPYAYCQPAPCDSVPCVPADSTCYQLPCNAPANVPCTTDANVPCYTPSNVPCNTPVQQNTSSQQTNNSVTYTPAPCGGC